MGRLILTLCTCAVSLVLSTSPGSAQINLATGCPATASSVYATNTADLAVDADTTLSRWIAPTSSAWIEVDLGAEYPIAIVIGKAAMTPGGSVLHTATGRTAAGVTHTLGKYAGTAYTNQLLHIVSTDATPVRYVRVTSTSPVSWIAWIDLRVYSDARTTATTAASWGRIKSLYR